MRILVTAGNTLVPIDRVRCLTNIFTGRTGARIAWQQRESGHSVILLTSHPEVAHQLQGTGQSMAGSWTVRTYREFEDLELALETAIRQDQPEVVIHCAAVSDYRVQGIYAPAPGTRFQPEERHWEASGGLSPAMADRAAGKIKSDEPEIWLRLVRTPKLIDRIRTDWHFRGILVKFKLEVGVTDEHLLDIAEHSRRQSAADLMVANTLEGTDSWAYLGPVSERYLRVTREDLPARLITVVEQLLG